MNLVGTDPFTRFHYLGKQDHQVTTATTKATLFHPKTIDEDEFSWKHSLSFPVRRWWFSFPLRFGWSNHIIVAPALGPPNLTKFHRDKWSCARRKINYYLPSLREGVFFLFCFVSPLCANPTILIHHRQREGSPSHRQRRRRRRRRPESKTPLWPLASVCDRTDHHPHHHFGPRLHLNFVRRGRGCKINYFEC